MGVAAAARRSASSGAEPTAEREAGPGASEGRSVDTRAPGSLRSRIALNATNFFIAETVTILAPFLADFLRQQRWSYGAIGIASAMPGLGVLLAMTPVGMWVDHTSRRRLVLAAAALIVALIFGAVPLVPTHPAFIDPMMFVAGAMESFFTPVLFALALALAGQAGVHRLVGTNQAWNHIGSIAASLGAMALLQVGGAGLVFYGLAASSVVAAASCLLIKGDDLHEPPRGQRRKNPMDKLTALLRDRRVLVFLSCVGLFHLANAPVLPLETLNMRRLGGTEGQVAGLVVIAQATMVPVAYLAGRCAERFGRKVTFGVAFVVLPLRIALVALAATPLHFLALQVLDGVAAGIYGVLSASICADLAGKKGRFNTLIGLTATALSLGAVVGPIAGGFCVEHFGFRTTFFLLTAVALAGCVVFFSLMEESGEPHPA
jgi:MFS family permease